jgi:hypothetical protein
MVNELGTTEDYSRLQAYEGQPWAPRVSSAFSTLPNDGIFVKTSNWSFLLTPRLEAELIPILRNRELGKPIITPNSVFLSIASIQAVEEAIMKSQSEGHRSIGNSIDMTSEINAIFY